MGRQAMAFDPRREPVYGLAPILFNTKACSTAAERASISFHWNSERLAKLAAIGEAGMDRFYQYVRGVVPVALGFALSIVPPILNTAASAQDAAQFAQDQAQMVVQQQQQQQQQQLVAGLSGVPPYCSTYGTCAGTGSNAFTSPNVYSGYAYYTGPCGRYLNFGLLDLLGSCPIKRTATGDSGAAPSYAPRYHRHYRQHAYAGQNSR